MIMMRLDDITARGYAACFFHFSNFDDRKNPLFLCVLLQLYTNNLLKLSRTAVCYSSFAHVTESDQDIQDTRQLSQTYSIYNKN